MPTKESIEAQLECLAEVNGLRIVSGPGHEQVSAANAHAVSIGETNGKRRITVLVGFEEQ